MGLTLVRLQDVDLDAWTARRINQLPHQPQMRVGYGAPCAAKRLWSDVPIESDLRGGAQPGRLELTQDC
eukprot:5637820-Pleurochrysis_carterae.AAC.3